MNKRRIGQECERFVEKYLSDHGFAILDRNFRYGNKAELDLVTMKEGILHFIEVKSRSGTEYGLPSEAVDSRKMRNIIKAAEYFIHINKCYGIEIMFDVAEVYFSIDNNDILTFSNINMIQNAF